MRSYEEEGLLYELFKNRVDDAIERGNWCKHDWSEIPIKNMETSHIENSLRMINRRGLLHLLPYISLLEEELNSRKSKGAK